MDIAKIKADDDKNGEEIIISISEDTVNYDGYWIVLDNGDDPCIQSRAQSKEKCELYIESAWGNWKTFEWIN